LVYAAGIPMTKRPLLAALAILVAWTLLDVLLHRLLLAPIYDASPNLWRPFDQMNVALIYAVTFVLIGVYVGTYQFLVRPKSLRAGLFLGGFIGLALGVSAGFGTFIHMPIPLALAWGWFIGGWLKGLTAGAIVGAVIINSENQSVAGSRAEPEPGAAPDLGGVTSSPGSAAPQPPRQVS
jgi:hypothetical protein